MVHIHRLSIQTDVPAAFVIRDPQHPYVDVYADERLKNTEFVAALMRLLTSDEWKRLMAQREEILARHGLDDAHLTTAITTRAADLAERQGGSPELIEWVCRLVL